MISSFVLQNLSSLVSVKFGHDYDCDFLYQPGGLDWGNIPATHNTYNYPNQIGTSFSSSKINNRDISIEGYAYYVLTDDERVINARESWEDYAYEKIKQKKKILNELINPLNLIRLTIGDYYIEGKPSATPKYGVADSENNIYFCKFLITIFCADPMFKKITQTITTIAGDYGMFFFPFFIKPSGYVFGVRNNYLILEVDNEGDIDIGGKIIITAMGEIVNPTVTNMENGQTIKVNKTMIEGETITINTRDGQEMGIWGEIGPTRSSYLQYWDFNNDWIKFSPGLSMIGYSCDNQAETKMDIKIEINPARFGLEEM